MTRTKSKRGRPRRDSAKSVKGTDLHEVDDLRKALLALTLKGEDNRVTHFRDIVVGLQAAIDPCSVTITTTNIPDGMAKLTTVLRQMSEASHKVFELVERQHTLRDQLSTLADQFGSRASSGALSPEVVSTFIQEHRAVSDQLESLAHEIVMAHEFQDLCGQSVSKVTVLLEGLDRGLRELLPTLGITPPSPQKAPDSNPDLDQAEMDAILRQLTTW